jgi:outer membrane protein OmpA-like peptidoglycan-associated protein
VFSDKIRPVSATHFFINSEEDKILFAHRKKSKNGDLDLLMTKKNPKTGRWEKPQLISENITSNRDEDYPFLTPDGQTLYFSSKGFNAIGGYDVFKSEYNPTNRYWSHPVSLKHPTNTISDDVQFKIDEESNSGYFVSNRYESNGDFDVFLFHEVAKVKLTGQVVDSLNRPSDFAEIHFYPNRTTGLDIKTMTDKDGNYNILVGNDDQLTVKIFYNNKLVIDQEIVIPAFDDNQEMKMVQDFRVKQERKAIPADLPMDEDPTYADLETIGSKFRATNKALLSNIYFDFGEYRLTTMHFPKLEPLFVALKENPKLRIEISGHTDNIGKQEINNRMSLLRATSITEYLTKKGISKSRMVPKGYGSSRPIASNDQEREGRELNRRIEVLVLE